MVGIEMLPARRASMASINSPWQEGQGLARCAPTGCFCQSCRSALASKANQGQSRLVTTPGRRCNSGMGLLVMAVWRDQWYDHQPAAVAGFIRSTAQFRNWITRADGPARPHWAEGGLPSRSSRYHLYIPTPCPLGPSHGDSSASMQRASPRCSRTRGALADGRPAAGHFAPGDGVGLPNRNSARQGVCQRDYTSADPGYSVASRCHLLSGYRKRADRETTNPRNHRMFNILQLTSALILATTTPRSLG